MMSKSRGRKNRFLKTILFLFLILLGIPSFRLHVEAKDTYTVSQVIVSLGDSYSSGEGIERFYGQGKKTAEKVEDPNWLAHRSEKSWPGMLRLPFINGTMSDYHGKKTHWYFVASSGAETKHLKSQQSKPYNVRGNFLARIKGKAMLDPQLKVFDDLKDQGKKADYVTLTLGGNDAGFASIIVDAAFGSIYLDINNVSKKIDNTWREFKKEGGIRDKLRKAYKDISDKAGPQAEIIVAGYPQLLAKSDKTFSLNKAFSKEEVFVINNAVTKFNQEIQKLTIDSSTLDRRIHFVDVESEFEGHAAYSKDPYINIVMKAQAEDLEPLKGYSAYSVHPNAKGAAAYAKCVQKKIDELENKKLERHLVLNEWKRSSSVQVDAVQYLSFSPNGQVMYSTPDARDDLLWSETYYFEAHGTYEINNKGQVILTFDEFHGAPRKLLLNIQHISLTEFVLADPERPAWREDRQFVTDFLPMG